MSHRVKTIIKNIKKRRLIQLEENESFYWSKRNTCYVCKYYKFHVCFTLEYRKCGHRCKVKNPCMDVLKGCEDKVLKRKYRIAKESLDV